MDRPHVRIYNHISVDGRVTGFSGDGIRYYRRVGDHRVDLTEALRVLHDEHQIRHVRTDSGGSLNGALLAAGLVDELAVIVDPVVSGVPGARALADAPDASRPEGLPLQLLDVERLDDGAIWLTYRVVGTTGSS